MNNLYTIGFTQKSARNFFYLLEKNSVTRIIDTRLNNTGQLAGFSKKDDLQYFCKTIINCDYVHWLESAPTAEILSAYKNKEISWEIYAQEYKSLIKKRKIEKDLYLLNSTNCCLLCSEAKPHHCHRSILALYLNEKTNCNFNIIHI